MSDSELAFAEVDGLRQHLRRTKARLDEVESQNKKLEEQKAQVEDLGRRNLKAVRLLQLLEEEIATFKGMSANEIAETLLARLRDPGSV